MTGNDPLFNPPGCGSWWIEERWHKVCGSNGVLTYYANVRLDDEPMGLVECSERMWWRAEAEAYARKRSAEVIANAG